MQEMPVHTEVNSTAPVGKTDKVGRAKVRTSNNIFEIFL